MVYGQEVVIPHHFKQQALKIAQVLRLDTVRAKKERLFQLQKLEKYRVNSIHHQEIHKKQKKSWHDRNLRTKNISTSDLVLLYNSKIKGKSRKLEIAWLGHYIVE